MGFVYCLEMIPSSKKSLIASLIMAFRSITIVPLFALYILFVSKYTQWYLVMWACVTGILGTILIFVPESPKFLVTKKKYDQARLIFAKIAKINKVHPLPEIIFD